MKILLTIFWLLFVQVGLTNDLLFYEGFEYGEVTDFTHQAPNPKTIGGIGFASTGWTQVNTVDYRVSISGSTSLETPQGYAAGKQNGFMSVEAGPRSTWVLRDLDAVCPLHKAATYWFSVIVKHNGEETDSCWFRMRDGGSSVLGMGLYCSKLRGQLWNALTSRAVNASSDLPAFSEGMPVLLLGKLVLNPAGEDAFHVKGYRADAVMDGEPEWYDVSVTTEVGRGFLNQAAFFVGGSSTVDFDELRMGRTFASVTGE